MPNGKIGHKAQMIYAVQIIILMKSLLYCAFPVMTSENDFHQFPILPVLHAVKPGRIRFRPSATDRTDFHHRQSGYANRPKPVSLKYKAHLGGRPM